MAATTLKVTLMKSVHGQLANIAASVRGLGLRKPNQSVTVKDTPENRGMIYVATPSTESREGGLRPRSTERVNLMQLNTLKPSRGSKRVRLRVGRGASAGQGKTSAAA